MVVSSDCRVCQSPASWGDSQNDLLAGLACSVTLDTALRQLQVMAVALTACTTSVASYKASVSSCRSSLDLKDSVAHWQAEQLLKKDSIADSYRRELAGKADPTPWRIATVALSVLSGYLLYIIGR